MKTLAELTKSAKKEGKEAGVRLFAVKDTHAWVKEKNMNSALDYQIKCLKALLRNPKLMRISPQEGEIYFFHVEAISQYSEVLKLLKNHQNKLNLINN